MLISVGYVRGIGEGLCQFGGSPYLVEDVPKVVGELIGWKYHVHSTAYAKNVRITGFPVGTSVAYTDTDESTVAVAVDSEDYVLLLEADNDARLRSSLNTLQLTAPLHSDVDFDLDVVVRTSGGSDHLYVERVKVLAVADPPEVSATDLIVVSSITALPLLSFALVWYSCTLLHELDSKSHPSIVKGSRRRRSCSSSGRS
jgi:hypothetical protein